MKAYRSLKAALSAAKKLANHTRRPVQVAALPSYPRARRMTRKTVELPIETMQQVVFEKRNPKRKRRNPEWLHGTPGRPGPGGYRVSRFYDGRGKVAGEMFTRGDERKLLLY